MVGEHRFLKAGSNAGTTCVASHEGRWKSIERSAYKHHSSRNQEHSGTQECRSIRLRKVASSRQATCDYFQHQETTLRRPTGHDHNIQTILSISMNKTIHPSSNDSREPHEPHGFTAQGTHESRFGGRTRTCLYVGKFMTRKSSTKAPFQPENTQRIRRSTPAPQKQPTHQHYGRDFMVHGGR